ncbi:two-component system, OmpR family, KDP operon response regulator KdpE [Parafrankia irregularis]|uniref:Two-component system, OmpR family, KDP operon response regulator KdpE n=1 Tax=Parafrankia irregularis TaxID=795642 RepID=A0A0S4QNY3_9ACTN|nr:MULTISPECIES: response regulator [Parafrankia]MBE3201358.1 response regulator [Parafrankia sp. CH37]CUU56186.1 two-component system, OmpR family, KDP operon response regulator KdpE [Parafrankia irregularis]
MGDGSEPRARVRVLFVDDEPQLLRAMRITLRAKGYDVRTAVGGEDALGEAAAHPPDIIVLDLGLPDLDGLDVIRGLRSWTRVPIIVLSGRTSGPEKIAALDAGADDYITKPFSVEELLARMRAVARRASTSDAGPAVDVGHYRVDLAARSVTAREDGVPPVHLTPTEWRLLEALVRDAGKLVSSRALVSGVWGPTYSDDTSSLRLYINRLRRKLEPDPTRPRHLTTEPGMGYRFQP